MKVEEREAARRMRREEGAPTKEIAAALRVSTSSVSTWVRDVELTAEQRAALAARNPAFNRQFKGQQTIARRAREARLRAQRLGREMARAGDPLHLAGCMLYWAEGTKYRQRLCFVNADVRMMQLFIRFVRQCYAVPDERMRFS